MKIGPTLLALAGPGSRDARVLTAMRRRPSAILVAALAMSLPGQAGVAQQATSPRVPARGERMKLELACARIPGWSDCGTGSSKRSEAGSFLGLAGDTLRIEVEDGDSTLAVPAGSVIRAWISEGQHHQTATGAMIGLVAGGIVGAGVGATVAQPGYESFGAVAGGGLGAVVGLIIGLGIGSSIRSEHWSPVALPESAPSAAWMPPQAGPMLTIRF